MAEGVEEGFFRPIDQQGAPPTALNVDAKGVVDVKSAPWAPAAVQKPITGQCVLVIQYMPDRPDMPVIGLGSNTCVAGAEVALAVSLSVILKAGFFIPVPR